VYQNFSSYLYEAQHVSGDTPPIIRSLKLHQQPLVLHTWRVVGRVVAGRYQRPATTRRTFPKSHYDLQAAASCETPYLCTKLYGVTARGHSNGNTPDLYTAESGPGHSLSWLRRLVAFSPVPCLRSWRLHNLRGFVH